MVSLRTLRSGRLGKLITVLRPPEPWPRDTGLEREWATASLMPSDPVELAKPKFLKRLFIGLPCYLVLITPTAFDIERRPNFAARWRCGFLNINCRQRLISSSTLRNSCSEIACLVG